MAFTRRALTRLGTCMTIRILVLILVHVHEGTSKLGEDITDAFVVGGFKTLLFCRCFAVVGVASASPISSISGAFLVVDVAPLALRRSGWPSGYNILGICTTRGSSLPFDAMFGVPIWRDKRMELEDLASIRWKASSARIDQVGG